MISLGLGDLIKLLDEHMGSRWRKIYVWSILIGAAVFIVGLPIREIVVPLVSWIVSGIGGLEFSLPEPPRIVAIIVWVVWLLLLAIFIVGVVGIQGAARRGRIHEEQAARYNRAAQQAYREAQVQRAEAERMLSDAKRIGANIKRSATRQANRRLRG